MIFGTLPLGEARGAILAHTQRLPGRVVKKGAVLDDDAIAALRAAGREEVIAARLEPGDVPEDEAADALAEAVTPALLRRSRAATGRVNLIAEASGLLRVDRAAIDRLNGVHESLTIGTLPDATVVAAKDMVATIKVVPFAVPGTTLAVAEAIARQRPPLTLHTFRPLRVGLVMTELPGLKESVLEGTVEATTARVEALSGTLLPVLRCPHAEAPIADALGQLIAAGADLLLVAGASAVVDRRDVGPAGIVRAGGRIEHFGMPVDPGNLICLGRIGTRPALVLPGCARSPAQNGIDFVLPRLFAGLGLTGAELAGMGVGGLLKDVGPRPLPRAAAAETVRAGAAPRRRPSVAAIVLAAGRSRRMAPRNKLLVPDAAGRPMVARVVDSVLGSLARPVIVVTGHQAAEIQQALAGRKVRIVHAELFADGLAESLKAGIRAVPPEAGAAIVCLGDMPLVGSGV
ncbi:MAG TPA: NTP transferase domain-containing protein, partial [Acetobacteraceae bacterium]|nr:NTP transferase domain-containing protein [Acetobacteraceae bacterium]